MEMQSQFSLADLTTFHIGGPADYFCVVRNEADVAVALQFAREKNIPILILGNGSNVVISDEGFQGLVLKNHFMGIEISDSGHVTVGAGENWDDVVAKCVDKNLAGIECLSAIPGSAGGGLVQNIGAYGQTLGDVVVGVEAIEISTGAKKIFTPQDCKFEYRNSWFKQNPNAYLVTGLTLQLTPNGPPTVKYPDVVKYFGDKQPTLSELRQAIIEIRAAKGYLIKEGFESYNTAGSYFKNPVVSKDAFEVITGDFGDESSNRFWVVPHGVKLAAAFLMQESGFDKGYREGHVGISPKHALSLVNFGGGTAVEIRHLADKIKQRVREKFNVELEEEVLYIGKF